MKTFRSVVILSLSVLMLSACGGGASVKKEQESKPAIDTGSISPQQAYPLALKAMQEQQYDQAVALMDIAVKPDNLPAEVLANAGIAYTRNNQAEKGIEYLKKALKSVPPNALNITDIAVELAVAYREAGKFNEARQSYLKILALDPNNAAAAYNLGILCDLYMQDLDCAEKYYQQYLPLAADDEKKKLSIWLKDVAKRKKLAAGG